MEKLLRDTDCQENTRCILLRNIFEILLEEVKGRNPINKIESLTDFMKSVSDDYGLAWSPNDIIPLLEKRIPQPHQERISDLIYLILGDLKTEDFESKHFNENKSL